MARIDNARLVCCCIRLESRLYSEHMHAKTKAQGAPLEGGRGGREMARIENAELVCYCIG